MRKARSGLWVAIRAATFSDRTMCRSSSKTIAEVATSQVALDITLLAQRQGLDVQAVMFQQYQRG